MFQLLPICRSAEFDVTGQYRYRLGRQWDPSGPGLVIIMLNPSQADATGDDPTIRRCMGLAQYWGFGAITVVNLFAYCTAYPRQLKQVNNPIGANNNAVLVEAAATGEAILMAWGNWGDLHRRGAAVLDLLAPFRSQWHCLEHNRSGHPRHPLYVRRDAGLRPWPEHRLPP